MPMEKSIFWHICTLPPQISFIDFILFNAMHVMCLDYYASASCKVLFRLFFFCSQKRGILYEHASVLYNLYRVLRVCLANAKQFTA
jgi:hypothetical protein